MDSEDVGPAEDSDPELMEMSSSCEWSDNEDSEAGPKWSDPQGTIVKLEIEAKKIPILTEKDTVSSESYGGLQLCVLSNMRRFKDMYQTDGYFFKNTKMMKLRIGVRSHPFMIDDEKDILQQGSSEHSFISVQCPLFDSKPPPEEVLKTKTWFCIIDFHPNLVRSEMDVRGGWERVVPHRRSMVSQYGFPINETLTQ